MSSSTSLAQKLLFFLCLVLSVGLLAGIGLLCEPIRMLAFESRVSNVRAVSGKNSGAAVSHRMLPHADLHELVSFRDGDAGLAGRIRIGNAMVDALFLYDASRNFVAVQLPIPGLDNPVIRAGAFESAGLTTVEKTRLHAMAEKGKRFLATSNEGI